MFPIVYEFSWSAGHLIFLGLFFGVVVVVAITVTTAILRSSRSMRGPNVDRLLWKADFSDLPLAARRCRHELNGEIGSRTCPNGFDCRACDLHPTFYSAATLLHAGESEEVMGVTLPLERFYHRGHTWAKPAEDGTFTVGLDSMAARVLGKVDAITLPDIGTHVEANGTGWKVTKGKAGLRFLSPLDGTVVAQGAPEDEWVLRIRPDAPQAPVTHLLRGDEVRHWATREAERLQGLLAPAGAAASLADGGELMESLPDRTPGDWDGILGSFFLQA